MKPMLIASKTKKRVSLGHQSHMKVPTKYSPEALDILIARWIRDSLQSKKDLPIALPGAVSHLRDEAFLRVDFQTML